MLRIAPPLQKSSHAIRHMGSTATRSSGLLEHSRHTSPYLPHKIAELKAECSKRQLNTTGSKSELVDRLASHDRAFHTSGSHRPTPPASRTIPLMQGFRTSAPKKAAHDNSTIDFFTFPEIPDEAPENPYARVRVPLLPDNYNPDRSPTSAHAAEALDAPLAAPEIHIIASHPERVAPAALSEVVGNDGLDVDLSSLTKGFTSSPFGTMKEPGVIQELWSGLVDDFFGERKKVAV